CSSAVIGPAVPKPCSEPTSRNVFPPEPPVESVPFTRTVLTVKGSLRRAKHRRALDCCAPFRPLGLATGGSGGNTQRSANTKTRPPNAQGLDKVAPYQNRNFRANCIRRIGLRMLRISPSRLPFGVIWFAVVNEMLFGLLKYGVLNKSN